MKYVFRSLSTFTASKPTAIYRRGLDRVLFAVLMVLAYALPVQSQSLRHDQAHTTGVAVVMLQPSFESVNEAKFFSLAFVVSGTVCLSDRLGLRAELPLSQYGLKGSGAMNIALGNPYLGFEFASAAAGLNGDLGLRVGLGSDAIGLRSGMAGDIGHWNAFYGDVSSVQGGLRYEHAMASDFTMEIRGGTDFWVYTSEGTNLTADWFYTYGVQLWYTTGALRLGSDLAGRAVVAPQARLGHQLETQGRTAHQMVFSIVGLFQRIQPGVHLLLPVDHGLADETSYVVGISMTISFL